MKTNATTWGLAFTFGLLAASVGCSGRVDEPKAVAAAEPKAGEVIENSIKLKLPYIPPGDAVKGWNDALTKGDVKAAESLTSSTSKDHIKQNFGSLEQLSKSYQGSLKNVELETKIIHEEISGDTAVVVYRVQYGDAKVKYWMDKLYLEGDEWKVAPQFVQTLTFKE